MSSPCARCPKVLGVSCCEVKGDEQLATLTWADVDRLREATGRGPESFTEWEWLGEEEAARWSLLHPRWRGYFGPVLNAAKRRGEILHSPRGTGGFGYDPIFYVPAQQQTFAEMTPDLKRSYSHRGQAFQYLLPQMETLVE